MCRQCIAVVTIKVKIIILFDILQESNYKINKIKISYDNLCIILYYILLHSIPSVRMQGIATTLLKRKKKLMNDLYHFVNYSSRFFFTPIHMRMRLVN